MEFLWCLAKLAAESLWSDMGTNGLGGTLLFVIPLGIVAMRAFRAPRGEKWATVVRRWKEELRDAFIVTSAIVVLLFGWEFSWKQPHTIWKRAESILLPALPHAPAPPPEENSDASVLQGEIDEIAKRLKSLPAPVPAAAFSVKTEYEMSSFGAPDKFIGLFAGYEGAAGWVLRPATQIVFFQITNLLPVRTKIERLQVSLDACEATDRIDMTMGGDVFITLPKNTAGGPAVGRTLIFRNDNTGRSMVQFDIANANLSRAGQLDLALLDRILAKSYLEPNVPAGGWLLFNSRCPGAKFSFLIEDVAGRSFRYEDSGSNEMKNGDLSDSRRMTVTRLVDLSGAKVSKTE